MMKSLPGSNKSQTNSAEIKRGWAGYTPILTVLHINTRTKYDPQTDYNPTFRLKPWLMDRNQTVHRKIFLTDSNLWDRYSKRKC